MKLQCTIPCFVTTKRCVISCDTMLYHFQILNYIVAFRLIRCHAEIHYIKAAFSDLKSKSLSQVSSRASAGFQV